MNDSDDMLPSKRNTLGVLGAAEDAAGDFAASDADDVEPLVALVFEAAFALGALALGLPAADGVTAASCTTLALLLLPVLSFWSCAV